MLNPANTAKNVIILGLAGSVISTSLTGVKTAEAAPISGGKTNQHDHSAENEANCLPVPQLAHKQNPTGSSEQLQKAEAELEAASEERLNLEIKETTLTQQIAVEKQASAALGKENPAGEEKPAGEENVAGEEKPDETVNQVKVTPADLKNAAKALAEATAKLTLAQEKLAKSQIEAENAEAARVAAQQQVAQLTAKLNELTDTTPADKLTQLEKELEEANKQLTEASIKATQTQEALVQLQEEIDTASEAVHTAQTDLQKTNEQLENTQEKAADLAASIGDTEAKLTDLETNLNQLNQQLNTVNEQLAEEEAKTEDLEFTRAELIDPLGERANLALYRIENGVAVRVTELTEAPADFSNYLLRGITASGAVIDVPVTSFTTDSSEGTPSFKATATILADLVSTGEVSVVVKAKTTAEAGVITSFRDLVSALRAGETNLRLANDLYADEIALDPAATSYVENNYSGALDGAGYKIHGLVKPLFAQLGQNARIEKLTFQDVAINSTATNTAVLAQQAQSATVNQVHVSGGSISGAVNVAGLISQANGVQITDSTVSADININHTAASSDNGGIIAYAELTNLTRVAYSGKITAGFTNSRNNHLGGLVGRLANRSRLENSYAQGQIKNPHPQARVGGLVGSTFLPRLILGRLRNTLSAMQVENGHLVNGHRGFAVDFQRVYTITGEASGNEDKNVEYTAIDSETANNYYRQYVRNNGASTAPDLRNPTRSTPYETASNPTDPKEQALPERALAYRNYEKLLPYATKTAIIRAANKLTNDDPLVTKELISVLPTVNGRISIDTVADAANINGLLLHFTDKTVDRRALAIDTRAKNPNQLASYFMAQGLPYTPQQFTAVNTALINALTQELNQVTFESIPGSVTLKETAWEAKITEAHNNAIAEARNKNTPEPTRAETEAKVLDRHYGLLYLRETFNAQKPQLAAQLSQLLAREHILPNTAASSSQFAQKVRDNKEALLLGLAYVNKWYNVPFEVNNLRDFFIFRNDFYGTSRTPLDMLIDLGKNYELLNPRENIQTYQKMQAEQTGRSELADALDDLRS